MSPPTLARTEIDRRNSVKCCQDRELDAPTVEESASPALAEAERGRRSKLELVSSLSLLARIVCGVDVVDACRPGKLNMQGCPLVPGPTKMRVLCRYHVQGACTDHLATLVQLFAHAEADGTAEHRDYLCIRMSVWRNLVVGGEFDALDDHLSFRWVAQQNSELGARWKGRVRLPCQFIRFH